MHRIQLKGFQEKCINKMLLESSIGYEKEILIKSPTGSGKTIILINYIDRYIDEISKDVIFIWFTPGQGDLEEQSAKKMSKYIPSRNVKFILDILRFGFKAGDTAFINWETVTRKDNTAIKEQERKNLFDRIAEATNMGLKFIVIIDEEHMNYTVKSEAIINAFNPMNVIRVSATPKHKKDTKLIEIDELDVIKEGLICKMLYINEGVENNKEIDDEYKYLLDLALNKQKDIRKEYLKINAKINPLIIIQLPNGEKSDILVNKIEKYLDEKGYNYENKSVSIWLSDKKENVDNLTNNNDTSFILIMKQAISTGWDCPRAKILVKLRDKRSETFETQTIGRIRRMPQAKHYESSLLDNCFLYTFDNEYTECIKEELGDNVAERKLIFLKEEHKNFKLVKEYKNNEIDELGSREAFEAIYIKLKEKYKLLDSDKKNNRVILEYNNFKFGTKLTTKISQGNISKIDTESLEKIDSIKIYEEVSTSKNGIDLKHSIGAIASKIGMKYDKTRQVLERLFMYKKHKNKGILNLNRREFYAFIINNEEKLKIDCLEAVCCKNIQGQMNLDGIKESDFKIPEIDVVTYNPKVRDPWVVLNNVYEEYPSNVIRSTPETLFEQYCEKNKNVLWIYKNGESSQQYLSIIYVDNMNKQWSFYPDYVVRLKNDETWIIETKGGEDKKGKSRNIDIKVENKFEALKRYALKNNLNWGFIRDYQVNQKLYLNNTEYEEDMNHPSWVELEEIF